ncbi:protein IWS1 homolog 1-like [Hibiscus syriacus]|uniref:protein IWS1 homolog 1-like n=1 Tax=Hibiscus syriacus TaxID=106335 RepID=UPI00192051E7|nr:protein IWS1 homolog 1-like [Hibiscus syriacus]
MIKTDSDGRKIKEADCVKAIGPEDPTEEDMNKFFSSLEYKLASSKTVVSQEEAKEALAKLDEAMNSPVDFYNSGKFSPLKQQIDPLPPLQLSKKKLLAMEESLKEVADRATKVVEDKNHLSENESIKLTITHNLNNNLVRYKEMELEVKQVEQKLVAYQEQVEEIQKERENILLNFLYKKHLQLEFLDHGILSLFKNWLEPLRASILNILTHVMPVDIRAEDRREQLRKIGLGKVIMLLSKSVEEITANRQLEKDLVENWSRTIFNKTSKYSEHEKVVIPLKKPSPSPLKKKSTMGVKKADLDLELAPHKKSSSSGSGGGVAVPKALVNEVNP